MANSISHCAKKNGGCRGLRRLKELGRKLDEPIQLSLIRSDGPDRTEQWGRITYSQATSRAEKNVQQSNPSKVVEKQSTPAHARKAKVLDSGWGKQLLCHMHRLGCQLHIRLGSPSPWITKRGSSIFLPPLVFSDWYLWTKGFSAQLGWRSGCPSMRSVRLVTLHPPTSTNKFTRFSPTGVRTSLILKFGNADAIPESIPTPRILRIGSSSSIALVTGDTATAPRYPETGSMACLCAAAHAIPPPWECPMITKCFESSGNYVWAACTE